jgi:hypothetical protein
MYTFKLSFFDLLLWTMTTYALFIEIQLTHHNLNLLNRWHNMNYHLYVFFVTDQQLHTLIRLGVSRPALTPVNV